jgi:hypothetical protein
MDSFHQMVASDDGSEYPVGESLEQILFTFKDKSEFFQAVKDKNKNPTK